MIFTKTNLEDAYILELEKKDDERGYFARTYCKDEFKENGISFTPVQANISYSKHKHTLRGMHYQIAPFEEAKLVGCIRGSIYDVIIDIREGSPTMNKWLGIEISEENKKMLFVPKGFAHGFLTLEDKTEASYLMSEFYKPGFDRGIRWDDSFYNIEWPAEAKILSEKDRNWPSVKES